MSHTEMIRILNAYLDVYAKAYLADPNEKGPTMPPPSHVTVTRRMQHAIFVQDKLGEAKRALAIRERFR